MSDVPATIQCEFCKSEIPADAKVCAHCRKATPAHAKKQRASYIRLAVAVVVAVAVVLALLNYQRKSHSDTKKYEHCIEQAADPATC